MARRWYGSLQNRLAEGKQFCDEIKVGTGVTEYFYSDRQPYEVIEVKDQKHVTIRRMDHKKIGDAYDNEWELISNEENPVFDLTKRGDTWYYTTTVTADEIEDVENNWEKQLRLALAGFDVEKIRERGKQTKYRKANISFGVAEYYYDYSF